MPNATSRGNSRPRPVWAVFAAGGLGDMVAALVSHPMDVVKVRMQLAGELSASAKRPGLPAQAISIARGEGLRRGLYRGLTASLARQGVFSTLRHGLYSAGTSLLDSEFGVSGVLPSILVGAAAGALGAAVANPTDVVLIRMQSDGHWPPQQRRGYRHIGHGLSRIVRAEGVARLWRGCGPTVTRAVLVTASQLPSYHATKRLLRERFGWDPAETRTHLAASTVSALCASLATCPADVVKTRIMNMQPGGVAMYSGALDCAARTLRAEGVLGFYKGLAPTFLRLAPHTIVLWLAQEQISALIDRWLV